MSVPLLRSPESIRDVERIVQYFIDQHTPATARKFAKGVTRALNLLAAFPEIGSRWESKNGRVKEIRFQNVRGFKYHLIFYRVNADGILVLRVLDGRRDIRQIL